MSESPDAPLPGSDSAAAPLSAAGAVAAAERAPSSPVESSAPPLGGAPASPGVGWPQEQVHSARGLSFLIVALPLVLFGLLLGGALSLSQETTGGQVPPVPTVRELPMGAAVIVRRGAQFRSSPELKQPSYCTLLQDRPATVLVQDHGRSTDAAGRSWLVYPIVLRDAPCEGGTRFSELRGWVSEEFLQRR